MTTGNASVRLANLVPGRSRHRTPHPIPRTSSAGMQPMSLRLKGPQSHRSRQRRPTLRRHEARPTVSLNQQQTDVDVASVTRHILFKEDRYATGDQASSSLAAAPTAAYGPARAIIIRSTGVPSSAVSVRPIAGPSSRCRRLSLRCRRLSLRCRRLSLRCRRLSLRCCPWNRSMRSIRLSRPEHRCRRWTPPPRGRTLRYRHRMPTLEPQRAFLHSSSCFGVSPDPFLHPC